MYWKKGKDENGWIIYNYFEIIHKHTLSSKPFYNPISKSIIYPVTKELVMKAAIAETEEDFEIWWHWNTPLRPKLLLPPLEEDPER